MEHLHDGEASVETNEVSKLERAHGDVGAVLHDGINRVAVTDTGLEADDSLVNVRHQDTVSKEAGRVGRDRGDLAHSLAELDGSLEGLGRGLKSADDLNTLLHGDGVHEVGGDDTGASLGVLGILGGGGSNAGDGDGRGVGGQNGMLGADLRKLGEDVKLELGNLRDGLNDEVDGGEVLKRGMRSQEGASLISLFLGDPRLGHILCKKFLYLI